MSEPTPDVEEIPAGTRAVAKYVGHEDSDDGVEVSLPGYLGAVPSILKPGDDFTFDAAHLDELDGQDEFDVSGVLDLDVESDRKVRDEIESIVSQAVVPQELADADAKAAEESPGETVVVDTPPTPPARPAPPSPPPGGSGPDSSGSAGTPQE